jgi:predicted glycosyltransferase involved in capsule biosynthesis
MDELINMHHWYFLSTDSGSFYFDPITKSVVNESAMFYVTTPIASEVVGFGIKPRDFDMYERAGSQLGDLTTGDAFFRSEKPPFSDQKSRGPARSYMSKWFNATTNYFTCT